MDRRRRIAPQRGIHRPPRVDLDDVIYGVHAVNETLVAGEGVRRLHVGDERKNDPALRNLLERARAANVPIRFESRAFFANFPYKAHQSVVAFGTPFPYISLDEAIALPRKGPALFVLLDHVTDPHNVGAVIRTTEAAGGTALVIPERRAAGVNATVRKSAAGAAAHLPVARVANIAQSIRTLKKAGIWVAGAALGPGSQPYTARPTSPGTSRSSSGPRGAGSRPWRAASAISSSRSRCWAGRRPSMRRSLPLSCCTRPYGSGRPRGVGKKRLKASLTF